MNNRVYKWDHNEETCTHLNQLNEIFMDTDPTWRPVDLILIYGDKSDEEIMSNLAEKVSRASVALNQGDDLTEEEIQLCMTDFRNQINDYKLTVGNQRELNLQKV